MRHVRHLPIAVTVCFISLSNPVNSAFAQTNRSPLFDRIYDGDYVWSSEFPSTETPLIAYGFGLFNQINERCPDVISQSEKQEVGTWVATLIGSTQADAQGSEVFRQAMDFSGKYLSYRSAARADVNSLTCSGLTINRVGQNVWRMLAGKKPRHLGETVRRSTLLSESEVPIENYHHYANTLPVSDAVWQMWKSDVEIAKNEYHVTVLECRYDEEPDDEKQEEQYYWGPSLLVQMGSQIPILWHTFLETAQMRMDRINRGGIHPFKTYGSPRPECPSMRDTNLNMKEIDVRVRPDWNYQSGPCVMQESGVFECPEDTIRASQWPVTGV